MLLVACIKAINGHEADSLKISAAFQCVRLFVEFMVVTNVCVSAEELDRHIPLLATDGSEDRF